MKKSNDINFVLEIFWAIVAVLTGIMGIYALFAQGFKQAYPFFIMCILSVLLFLARRALRHKKARENS